MSGTVSRLIIWAMVGLGSLSGSFRGAQTAESAIESGAIAGTGTLSGTVQAPKPNSGPRKCMPET